MPRSAALLEGLCPLRDLAPDDPPVGDIHACEGRVSLVAAVEAEGDAVAANGAGQDRGLGLVLPQVMVAQIGEQQEGGEDRERGEADALGSRQRLGA